MTTARDIPALLTRLRDEADLCRNDGAADVAALLDEAAGALEDVQEIARRGDEIILKLDQKLAAAQSSLTARDEALACIRVFAQDCIENGHFDRGALGNLYSIRDLCDSKGENLK